MQIIKAPKVLKNLDLAATKVRLPHQFPWKLLGKMTNDLVREESSAVPRAFSTTFNDCISQLKNCLRSRDIDQLLKLAAYLSPRSMLKIGGIEYEEFFILYQLGSLLKKFPFPGKNTSAPALETFLRFERECKLFNAENYKAFQALSRNHPDFLGIIPEIRADIERCIGKFPNVQRVYDCAQHGPGTAIGLDSKTGEVTTYFSWLPPYTVSSKCRPYAMEAITSYPQWIGALDNWYRETFGIPKHSPIDMDHFWESVLVEENCCKYASVPKTAETDRSIAIEPALNVYLQLGVDRIIRSRLKKRWHYNLNSQELNQELALEGSLADLLATLDLKGASETVTLMVCLLLLPEGWYDLLTDLRSEYIRIDKDVLPLHKMSAMGNGFTFALESLIFASLVRCAMRRTKSIGRTAVYGDDLIVPKTAVEYLLTLLNVAGFTVNIEKSFTEGPFRESCGKDYYRGQPVRPFFLKSMLGEVSRLFYVHNSLCKLEDDLPWPWAVRFDETKAWIRKFIPKQLVEIRGPRTESLDTHIWSERHIHRTANGFKFFPVLLVRAKVFNHRTDFFFRRLMVSHKPAPPRNKWEEITMTSTGSAFDVTKRGRVTSYISVQRVW